MVKKKKKSLSHSCPQALQFSIQNQPLLQFTCNLLAILSQNHKHVCGGGWECVLTKMQTGKLYTLFLTLFFSLKSVFWSVFFLTYTVWVGGRFRNQKKLFPNDSELCFASSSSLFLAAFYSVAPGPPKAVLLWETSCQGDDRQGAHLPARLHRIDLCPLFFLDPPIWDLLSWFTR